MQFKVTDGLNKISIGLSEIGSYINFDNPLAAVWYDNRGSIGQYFSLLPYNQGYRNELRNRIIHSLDNDYSSNMEELYDILKPLFKLFNNGEYSLDFYNSNEKSFFVHKTINGGFMYNDWSILFTDITDIKNSERIKNKYELDFIEAKKKNKYFYSLLDYSTFNFYDGYESYFIATQPLDKIDKERVEYFENEIKNGNRPAAILFNCYLNAEDLYSGDFVLDGHHKLLAYQNLNIYPPIIEIKYLPQSREEVNYNIEKLIEYLYPWQIEDILKNWYKKEEYLTEIIKNPNSKIHNFIKNGIIREIHSNGQLKHEAFYINDKIDGVSRGWYENGQLEYEHFYNKGVRVGIWKDWYEIGKIEYVQPFNEKGKYDGHLVSYYENGQIRWEQFLINGINKDGVSYSSWYENGNKEAELKYLNGMMIERRSWDIKGKLK